MRIYSNMRFAALAIVAIFALIGSNAYAATTALLASTSYVVTLEKFLSDGTLSAVSSTTVTSDTNGKIAFTFSNVPTCPTTNFLSVKVTTAADTATIVRRSFSPAPPANGTNLLGANGVSTKQGEAMVATGALLGSDDPIAVAFGLLFTRTDQLTTTDIDNIAILGKEGIINGMEAYMTNPAQGNVSAAAMTTFKEKLICNQPNTDLSNLTSLFKSAVDTPAQASDDMAKAAGVIGDSFIAAAAAANIDLDVILAGFDSAGDKVGTGAGATAFAAITAGVQASILQGVNSFATRLGVKKVQQRYSAALTALGVSGAEVTTFNNAVTALGTNMATNETTFGSYFEDPAGFNMGETIDVAHAAGRVDKTIDPIAAGVTVWTNAGSPPTPAFGQGLNPATSTIRDAIDFSFNNSFNVFSAAIASSSADITLMRNNISTAIVGNLSLVATLASGPQPVGTYRDFGGTSKNWPIPQTGSVNFVSNNKIAGGSLGYTRSALTVPGNMAWLNGTGARKLNFGTGTPSFEALLGMQEDVMIAENTRFYVFDAGNGAIATPGSPTNLEQQAAKAAFITNLAAIAAAITGTTDGATNLTTAQKEALVQSQQQPSIR
ncbi:MAG: hypothetical protein R8K53_09660 [Mariprofundaceae bacterium]